MFALVLVTVQAQENGDISVASRVTVEPTCTPCQVSIGAKKVILKGKEATASDLEGTALDYPLRFQSQRGPWYNDRMQSAENTL